MCIIHIGLPTQYPVTSLTRPTTKAKWRRNEEAKPQELSRDLPYPTIPSSVKCLPKPNADANTKGSPSQSFLHTSILTQWSSACHYHCTRCIFYWQIVLQQYHLWHLTSDIWHEVLLTLTLKAGVIDKDWDEDDIAFWQLISKWGHQLSYHLMPTTGEEDAVFVCHAMDACWYRVWCQNIRTKPSFWSKIT